MQQIINFWEWFKVNILPDPDDQEYAMKVSVAIMVIVNALFLIILIV